MSDAALKSFTSRKLDLMNAINADTRLNMSDRVVACELLHYASPDGEIFPSQELLARTLGLSARSIKYRIAALVEAGWISVERPSRAKSNRYFFDAANIGFFQRRRQLIRDELAARRGNLLPLKKSGEVQPVALPEVQPIAPGTGNPLPPNTLRDHLEGNTFNPGQDKNTDLSVGHYARDDGEEELAQRAPPERRSKQALPAQSSQSAYIEPDFDALQFEIAQRRLKSARQWETLS